MKHLSQESWYPGRDSNYAPPEQQTEAISYEPHCCVRRTENSKPWKVWLYTDAMCWISCFWALQVLCLLIRPRTPKKGSARTSLGIIRSSSREPRKKYTSMLLLMTETYFLCICSKPSVRPLCTQTCVALLVLYWFIRVHVFHRDVSLSCILSFVLQFLSFIQTKGYFCQKEKWGKKNLKMCREPHNNTYKHCSGVDMGAIK
jgi:hypothetical protein